VLLDEFLFKNRPAFLVGRRRRARLVGPETPWRSHGQHTKRALDPHDLRMSSATAVDDVKPVSAPLTTRLRRFDLRQFPIVDPGTPPHLDAFPTVEQELDIAAVQCGIEGLEAELRKTRAEIDKHLGELGLIE
jgi:hypothetical protein